MSDRWPDLDVLQLLVGVAELGSVGAAPERVGVSQPSASTSITRCERRLPFKLLDRSTRGSTPTTDGALRHTVAAPRGSFTAPCAIHWK
ncbi:MAG: helix-turn-helix domain-containing protein [Thermomicrobiales bacterium]